MIAYLLGFLFGYTLTETLGSWVDALVVITCLSVIFRDDSQPS